MSSSREPPRRISPRRCRWARGQALTPQEVSRGCWHPRHGHSASWVALVAPCNARSWPRGGDEAARSTLSCWSGGRGHPGDILGTSRGHPGDIHQLLLLAALQQSLSPSCSRQDPAQEVPPTFPNLPKMPPGEGPQRFPALPPAAGHCPYQVGCGGRALGVLLGRIARAGTEVGAGHAAPVEGAQDADGGLARAEDEELLPVTRVGGVVPQHLA